ncbi:hypothetical protein [Mesorhizobium sp. M0058]|uniref:hypothetical protein n=1 Tax=Mesorhizobium sp. M0058 TaxID=2956865 RepID=UPI003336EBC0
MSRSGYSDDCDDQWRMIMWRGTVKSAIRGKRGQAFLREMLAAMDALPEKRLVASELEAEGQVCAIGSVGRARGVDMSQIDPENYDAVAATFGIAAPLAQEIVFMNDEYWDWSTDEKGHIRKDETGRSIWLTPEERFTKMRAWIERNISKGDAA